MQTKTKFEKVWNIVSTVLVVILVLFAIFLLGSRIIGLRVFNVISGSMEPKYSKGDLIYVDEVKVNEITNSKDSPVKVGTPITFVVDNTLTVATHRVVRIDYEEQKIYTKGDANKDEDRQPVLFKNVIGVPVFSIPLLGYVADFIQNPPGTYIAIGVGLLLILLVFLPDFFKKKDGEQKPAAPAAPAASASNEELLAELEELRRRAAEAEALNAAHATAQTSEAEAEEATEDIENAASEEIKNDD